MSVVTVNILSEGAPVNAVNQLIHVEVRKEVNRLPVAQLTLVDGDAARRRFAISQSDAFTPGKAIEIRARREGERTGEITLFKGIVVGQRVEADLRGSQLVVELKDSAIKMSSLRRTTIFREQKDSDILSGLIRSQGLRAGEVTDTGLTHPEMVQYQCSDWDFLVLRAEANGLLVSVDDGQVSVVKPNLNGARHRYEYGMDSIYSLEMQADAAQQIGAIGASSWDVKNQALQGPENASRASVTPGNLRPNTLADAVGAATLNLSSSVWMENKEMKAWADGRLLRSALAMVRGRVSVEGDGAVKPLHVIDIQGVSNKFNGRTLVTAVRHEINPDGWRTDIQFGLDAEPFAQAFRDIQEPPASGLLPAILGLQIGVVDAFEADPQGQVRVKVRIPALQADDEVLWARLLFPDAGKQRGYFFLPETGDEVAVGFLNGDPRQPIIIGSLYSSTNEPPVPAGDIKEENFIKGIFSREGIRLHFDDEKKTLTIATLDNQHVLLNGADKKIEIKDANDNSITLDNSGIVIKSAKDLKIEASGKVEIKGSQVDVK